MDKLIVLLGPTAVGKTATSLRVAEHFGLPIINADSRQLYAGIPIGTAAPTGDELRRVRHYFVGTHALTDYYSASRYESDVLALLRDDPAFARSECALLSGGSMMYIDAVCHGIDDIPTISGDIRCWMKARLADEGLEALVDELHRLDPDYCTVVDRKNPRRVVHALEICHQTGRTYTSYRTSQRAERWFETVKIGLVRERAELYSRINRRVEQMVEDGLVEEALRVYPYRNENALNTVGYKEMFDYLDGLCTLPDAVERIQGNTRKYCRKQLTWFKRDPEVRWHHPDDIEGIIDDIQQTIHPKSQCQ